MFMLATIPPAIRLFPSVGARYGGAAGWLAPVVGVIAPLVIVVILHALFKRGNFADLHDAFRASVGGFLAKVLLTAYLVWTFALFLLYVRYYAERMTASLFTSVNLDFFIIAMLLLVFFAARAKVAALARFSEISILIFAVVLAVFAISLLPTLRLGNVMPVTHYDIAPVIRSSYPIVSVWGFITLFFFLKIDNTKDIKKHGVKTALILAGATMVMLFLVVGSLGPNVAARMPRPFFQVSRLIDIMQSFDRFEAVLSSILVIADFILITAFVFIMMNIIKKLFGLREAKFLAGPIVMLGYAGSLGLAASTFELERVSNSPAMHAVNLALCLAVPAVVLAVGKVRRRV